MFSKNNSFVRQFLVKRVRISVLIILLGFLSSCFTLLIPISVGKYYELVLGYTSKRLGFIGFIPNAFWNTADKFLIFFGIIIILRFLFYFCYEILLRNESERFIKEIKDYLFSNQLKITLDTYKKKGTGRYLLRYTGDINSLKNWYRKGTISILIDFILLGIGVYALFRIDNLGGIVVLSLIVAGYVLIKIINFKLEKASLKKRDQTSVQVAYVNRILSGIITIKSFNRSEIEIKRYKSKSSKILAKSKIYNKWFLLNSAFIYLLQYSTLLAVLAIFYRSSADNNFNASALISFILLYKTLFPAIRRIYKLESVLKFGKISERKLINILEQEQDDSSGVDLKLNNPRLEIIDLKFHNHTSKINFISKKKQLCYLELNDVGMVLPLIETLLRLNKNYSGQILINKSNISEVKPSHLRSAISVCTSKFPLVGKTVYEAIVEERSRNIKNDVKALFSFFKTRLLPKNDALMFDSKIGENGSDLTAIQKEFLCFLRGFTNNIKHSKFILIDKFQLLAINERIMNIILPELDKTIIFLKYD